MTDLSLPGSIEPAAKRPNLDKSFNPLTMILFGGILAGGLLFVAYSLYSDIDAAGTKITSYVPFLLLFVALLIALGFEFVNGFHDTANAVATVIYTHALPAEFAVIWSGFFNFLGVALSTGAVAFGIISLLPVELILQVGSSAGFAMVFALLIAAIVWNLGTWSLGLPASSSHTMIGSIIGVGVANALLRGRDGTSGVDWGKATEIGEALLFSPIVGFVLSAALLLLMKFLIRRPELYNSPEGNTPPPWWIRGLLILTCTGVSFAHGSNDGQKGMGLIMLILIGVVPTVYALNRAMPPSQMQEFVTTSAAAAKLVEAKAEGHNVIGDPRPAVTAYVAQHQLNDGTFPSLAALMREIARQVSEYGSLAEIPSAVVSNTRNDMYLASEAIRLLMKDKEADLSKEDVVVLNNYKRSLDNATKFIPFWGEDRGGDRARPRHHGRLEAHSRYGRGEDRQDPSFLWPGRSGRARGSRDDLRRRRLWVAGVDDPRALLGRCRNHGSEWIGRTDVDAAQYHARVGPDVACRNDVVGFLIFCVQQNLLNARMEAAMRAKNDGARRCYDPSRGQHSPTLRTSFSWQVTLGRTASHI
jgi:PiT family inorganic phosphate transporter